MSERQPPVATILRETGLPLEDTIVIGSGILDKLGIREAHDIDVVVAPGVFAKLAGNAAFTKKSNAQGDYYEGPYELEVWEYWANPTSGEPVYYNDLLEHTILIDSVRYVTLLYVREWKQAKGRPKDSQDILLIDEYIRSHDV